MCRNRGIHYGLRLAYENPSVGVIDLIFTYDFTDKVARRFHGPGGFVGLSGLALAIHCGGNALQYRFCGDELVSQDLKRF
jgi:hypothetical protein